MIPQLAKIAEDLNSGRIVPAVTTREFLSWFSAQRRGYWVVRSVRKELEKVGLQTVPDFESAYIDAQIELRRVIEPTSPEHSPAATPIEVGSVESTNIVSAPITALVTKDPTYRISKLAAANQVVVFVRPDASLQECITTMLLRDFSKLPVMATQRDVKGMISWRAVGSQLVMSTSASRARDIMVQHHEIRDSASIFDAIPQIVAHEYVLVRDAENRIAGIITATDLSQQFLVLSEPFLLLGEIENLIRTIIGDRFSPTELSEARDSADASRSVREPCRPNVWRIQPAPSKPRAMEKIGPRHRSGYLLCRSRRYSRDKK
jgi:predicted transcriptional regulator